MKEDLLGIIEENEFIQEFRGIWQRNDDDIKRYYN